MFSGRVETDQPGGFRNRLLPDHGRHRVRAAGRPAIGERAPSPNNRTATAIDYCRQHFERLASDALQEEFHIVTLDTKLPLQSHRISVGTLDASLVHPREVFKPAIRDSAAAILLVHNHPSGDPTPSRQDREITERLKRAGELLRCRSSTTSSWLRIRPSVWRRPDGSGSDPLLASRQARWPKQCPVWPVPSRIERGGQAASNDQPQTSATPGVGSDGVTDKPDQILIFCEGCKRETKLRAIQRQQGICPSCQHDTWHLQAVFLARQDNSDATALALNSLGLGLLASSGINLSSPIPGEKRPVNGFDIHDVTAAQLVYIASPEVDPQIKLQAFVEFKRNEQFQQHRRAMAEQGSECRQCGMLFVVSDQKPWTLVGTCSKVCCAAHLGAVDYALVEGVCWRSHGRARRLKQQRRDSQIMQAACAACGHAFEVSRIYAGLQRKCPACGQKVLIPTE